MAQVNKIDSNATGLRYAEEDSIGTLGTPTWYGLEPNSYNDFGGEIATIARNPINIDRQRQKGVTTDLDAAGGFNHDLVQDNLQDILQGFFFADLRRKGEETVTAVDLDTSNPDEFEVAATAGFLTNSLILGTGFTNAGNNGLFTVTAITTDTSVEVADGELTAEASPPSDAKITVVGHVGAAGDLTIDVSGNLPVLASSSLDFTTLGLIPGEWIWIGGATASDQFFNSENNGFARIFSITANALTLDKTQSTMVTDDGTDTGSGGTNLAIQLFFGRVLKNENTSTLIQRRTYNLERTLGAPDGASPSAIQSEYLVGAVPSELVMNFSGQDKVNLDMNFVATDHETRDAATGVKSGTRPTLAADDAFNTSSDFTRLKMHVLDPTDSNPTALFAYLTDFSITINNNVSPNKAISVLGAFDITAGQFTVSGSATAYFSNVSAVASVRANADVTIDFALVKSRIVDSNTIYSGIVCDLPLLSLGDGRANVEQDEPITLPITKEAAADRDFDHTLLMVFFDYLPSTAN